MYAVHFYENKNLLLSQLLNRLPEVGDNLKIKGKKGTVSDVIGIDESKFHVQVVIEIEKSNKKTAVDNSKKKRR